MSQKHPLQTVLEILEYNCFKYSGRGMIGKECLAIKVDTTTIGKFFGDFLGGISSGKDLLDTKILSQIQEAFSSMRQDTLMDSIVIYFTKVQFTK
jgi:hypothetical protein